MYDPKSKLVQDKKPPNNPSIKVGFLSHDRQSSKITHDSKIRSEYIGLENRNSMNNCKTSSLKSRLVSFNRIPGSKEIVNDIKMIILFLHENHSNSNISSISIRNQRD